MSLYQKIKKKVTRLSINKVSLKKQLVIIFTTLLLVVILLLMPFIDRNLSAIVDTEMFTMLATAQSRPNVVENRGRSISEKQIYYLRYANHQVESTLASSNWDTYNLFFNVFAKKVDRISHNEVSVIEAKARYDKGNIYYRVIKEAGDGCLIAFAYDNYYDSLIASLKRQIIYVAYIAIFVIAVILYIWVNTLLKPLTLIKNYINDIKVGKRSTLYIHRNDEIGIVSEALVDMKEYIDKQNKTKEEMIHNISHDLKTPIALIKTYGQSIKDGIYPYGDKDASIDVILENADRLEKKVYSLLYLNRLDYMQSSEKQESIAMKPLLTHITSQLSMLHPTIEMECNLSECNFNGKEEYWRTCVENIIQNAYRYVNHKIIVTLREDFLEIYNDGDPIDEESIESLFKPYEKGVKGQFGLGLAIVHKIVTMYGYSLTARNHTVGVSFRIQKNKEEETN